MLELTHSKEKKASLWLTVKQMKSIAAALCEAQHWVRHLDAEAIAVLYAAKWYRQTEREDKNKQRLYTRMEYYRGIADKRPMQSLEERVVGLLRNRCSSLFS